MSTLFHCSPCSLLVYQCTISFGRCSLHLLLQLPPHLVYVDLWIWYIKKPNRADPSGSLTIQEPWVNTSYYADVFAIPSKEKKTFDALLMPVPSSATLVHFLPYVGMLRVQAPWAQLRKTPKAANRWQFTEVQARSGTKSIVFGLQFIYESNYFPQSNVQTWRQKIIFVMYLV